MPQRKQCPNIRCQSMLGLEESSFQECDTCGARWNRAGNITNPEDLEPEDDDSGSLRWHGVDPEHFE